ncbi:hypothetical protein [Thermoflavimicrobium daqui]|uniref:hypothetical protein n=1 Tax=Thermoflavimicrobium daqui TaxID=2137476 RepID=UPI00143CE27D|nr:hypothetical protein [Thermoflavimicrobium daqui]
MEAGSPKASKELSRWILDWRLRGRPGYASLQPVISESRSSKDVRVVLKKM